MSAIVPSVTEAGMQSVQVDVECHLSNGLPNIVIVGLGSKSVDESKERIRSAFAEANLELPRKRITLNLAPADLPKDGTSFDLPMAAAILAAAGQTSPDKLLKCITIGELGLDGSVRPVRGIIGKILSGRSIGIQTYYIPAANLAQASLVPGVTIYPVSTLREFYLDQSGAMPIKPVKSSRSKQPVSSDRDGEFADIIGQSRAKRAMEIAAAGGHNILLNGPPGTGKSMLAKALPSILPDLELEEMLEVTHLHSLASRQYDKIVTVRPFRAPHHTASEVSILGGGQNPRPGEISLAHHGVLFFDELPEYGRSILEALRQPLEDKTITVARAKDTINYPADFMFVATSNPCPCGYYGSSIACTCAPFDLVRYQRKISGPILDRIDLYVDVDEIKHEKLLSNSNATESSHDIKKRIMAARATQAKRYNSRSLKNSLLSNKLIKKHANLSPEAKQILDTAGTNLHISARAYMKIIRVARTIADLNHQAAIGVPEITEALQYRRISN